jgi:hypothetical protein
MNRTRLHVIEEMRDAIAWYQLYRRMGAGKPDIYIQKPLIKVVRKLQQLEAEYNNMGGSKYDSGLLNELSTITGSDNDN